MSAEHTPHKEWDGDDPRVLRIFATHRFVPLNLYDEITKLAEYAVGELIEEHNGLLEQLEALRAAVGEFVGAYPEHPGHNYSDADTEFVRLGEIRALRAVLNPAKERD